MVKYHSRFYVIMLAEKKRLNKPQGNALMKALKKTEIAIVSYKKWMNGKIHLFKE